MSIYSEARDAFNERFEDVLNGSDDVPVYWQDDLTELADGLVPVYTADLVREWLDAGCPDIEDPGLIEGVTDVTAIISAVMYEQYSLALYMIAREYDWD